MTNALSEWGWTGDRQEIFEATPLRLPARVVAEHRTLFHVQSETGEFSAQISGRLRHRSFSSADLPAVGDWVVIEPIGDTEAVIHRTLPRKSKFSRRAAGTATEEQVIAANIDLVWIVSSLDRDLNPRRIERYLTLAWESGATPVIVLTKSDLCQHLDQDLESIQQLAAAVDVHVTSCHSGNGLEELRATFGAGETVALLGSSGVGKSTLINSLLGSQYQVTQSIREIGKGRHTTTHRQLIRLPGGGLLIDTPGMRELQLWDGEAGVAETFADIEQLSAECRFSDCGHSGEPGCAVTAAIEEGRLPKARLESFQKLQRELAYQTRQQDVHVMLEEKRRWKSITKSMRHHPKYQR
ncbi:MAG: ribosome small subunit-dependent GTPase A [Planctomycetota bacterium]